VLCVLFVELVSVVVLEVSTAKLSVPVGRRAVVVLLIIEGVVVCFVVGAAVVVVPVVAEPAL